MSADTIESLRALFVVEREAREKAEHELSLESYALRRAVERAEKAERELTVAIADCEEAEKERGELATLVTQEIRRAEKVERELEEADRNHILWQSRGLHAEHRAEKAERELAIASEMIASMQAQRNQAVREREEHWQAKVVAERERDEARNALINWLKSYEADAAKCDGWTVTMHVCRDGLLVEKTRTALGGEVE